MKQIEAVVRLSYPVTNRPNEITDDSGRYVQIRIEDGASGEDLIRIDMSAVEWTQIMAGEITRVTARTSDRLDRVGKQVEAESRLLGRGNDDPERVAAAIAEARTEGWEEVSEERSNRGRYLRLRRWVNAEES